jgi:hypothetical protein
MGRSFPHTGTIPLTCPKALVHSLPNSFTADPDHDRYLSDFTPVNGTGTQTFTYLQRVNRFDPTSAGTAVNAATDTFTVPNHGLQTGDAVYYEVDPSYSKRQAFPMNLAFDPRDVADGGDVDYAHDTIATDTTALHVGDVVTYQIGYDGETATPITNLTPNVDYQIESIDRSAGTVTLKTTAGAHVDLVKPSGDLGRLHNLRGFQTVTVGDTPIRNLSAGTGYYAVVIDADHFQLTETYGEALQAQGIDISNVGATGTGHVLLDPTEAFNLFGNRAKNGVGVSVIAQILNNDTEARILPGVVLYAGAHGDTKADENRPKALAVRARDKLITFNLAQGGGDAEGFGFTGSGIGLGQTSTTIAQNANDTTIESGPILVQATNDNLELNLVGSFQQTDSVGVGVGGGGRHQLHRPHHQGHPRQGADRQRPERRGLGRQLRERHRLDRGLGLRQHHRGRGPRLRR